jgi:hypothetical protein
LAAGRYEPFAMLACCWAGKKGQTVDDFNPWVLDKRKPGSRDNRRVRFSELAPLLKQWLPEEGIRD